MRFPLLPAILEFLTPQRFLERLTLVSKMLAGYLLLVVLIMALGLYALASLQRLRTLNDKIINVDIFTQQQADRMMETLLAQDAYEKRYLILQSYDMRRLFIKRGKEFDRLLSSMNRLPNEMAAALMDIGELHARYQALSQREAWRVRSGDLAGAAAISNGNLKTTYDRLLERLRRMSNDAKQSQESRTKRISEVGTAAFSTTAALCLLGIMLGALSGIVVTHHIFSTVKKLTVATEHIAAGDFQYDPHIVTRDEIGNLSQAFLVMGRRLGKLEEINLDASPLTRLPGGVAIEKILLRRMESGNPFAFCVLDLDNFKAFNDHYGYARGNEVIKAAAKIIETSAREKGSPEDFVGHIGGDDFVVITTPAAMRSVCGAIIQQFDERIPQFYSEQDRRNGFIFGKNRQGQDTRFPLMTISIAIVTNEQRSFTNPLEVSEIAAELKDYAKTIPSSAYVIDKRRVG